MAAIFDADGRTFDHPVTRQILHGQQAGIVGIAHGRDDAFRDAALVKARRALGCQAAQGFGIGRVGQPCPRRDRLAIWKEIGRRRGIALQRLAFLGHQRRQARRDGEAFLGQAYAVVEQARPIRAAPFAMRGLQQGGCAGGADRQAAHHRLHEVQRLAFPVQKQPGRGRHGGGLAAVQRGQLARFGVVPDQKGTAPQARALRLD